MVKKINSSEFEQVKNNKAIIVDFSAEWCGPCTVSYTHLTLPTNSRV